MKKSTQKMLMSMSIILVFGISSIAYVFSGFNTNNNEIKPLDKYVIEGEIDQRVENAYINGGVTFLRFYDDGTTGRDIVYFLENAPESFTTSDGKIQLIVLKLNSTASYARIVNLNGENNVYNITTEKIFDALCTQLLSPPIECVLRSINITP